MNTARLCQRCGTKLMDEGSEEVCAECRGKVTPKPAGSVEKTKVLPNGWAPATTTPSTKLFGDYELLEEVARGGMGVVWKARQASLNRIVAVKMILSGQLAGEAEVRRFQIEAQAAAQLQHPNIVAIHEVGEHEGHHYFSMDFVEGQSLAELVFHRPLPPERAAKYLKTIAEAIQYAHERGVLHRDLKPSNVLVDAAGEPRVTDFGLAKLLEKDVGLTDPGAVMGSPNYMSPEQAAGKIQEVGRASDVYSLGAILYELITGQPPFHAATAVEILRQVLDAEPAAPRWLNPGVPIELETICLKCLDKDPSRRYRSAKALGEDLGRFLRHEPVLARPASSIERVRKWARRKPAAAGLVMVSAMALLALMAGALWYAATLKDYSARINERLHQSLVQQARGERLLGHRERALQFVAEAAAMKATPDLRTEALEAIIQPGLRRILEVPFGRVAMQTFSADGTLLAVGGDGFVPASFPGASTNVMQTHVRVWRMPKGELLAQVPWTVEAGPFALSPTAPVLAVPQIHEDGASELTLWDFSSGSLVKLAASGPPHFSPDGRHLAMQESNRVSVWNITYAPLQANYASAYPSRAAVYVWTQPGELLMQDLPAEGRGRLFRWNIESGKQIFPINDTAYTRTNSGGAPQPLPGYRIRPDTEVAVAVSPDGATVVSRLLNPADKPPELFVHEIATGKKVGTVRASSPLPDRIHVSTGGRYVVFPDSLEPGRMRVYDINRSQYLVGMGEPVAHLYSAFERLRHNEVMSSGSFSTGSQTLQYQNRQILSRFSDRPSPEIPWISGARNFSPGGSLLSMQVYGGERSVGLWEIGSPRRLVSLPNAWRPVWSGNGRWLAVNTGGMLRYENGGFGISGDMIQVWEVVHGVPSASLLNAPHSIAFSSDGRRLTASGYLWGSLLWKVEQTNTVVRLDLLPEKLNEHELFFASNQAWLLNDKRRVLSGSLLQVSRYGSKEKPFSLEDPSWVLARNVSRDGRRLVLACTAARWQTNAPVNGPHLQLWDLEQHRRLGVWAHPDGDKASTVADKPLAFSPDGRWIASACYTSYGAEVWDAASGQRVHVLQQPPAPPWLPQLPQPGILRRLLHWIFPGSAPVISQTATPPHHFLENSVSGITFTPDSRLILTCAEDRVVIRETASGRELRQCLASTNLLCLAVHPDGGTVAAGAEDGQVYFWEVATGQELARWTAQESAVTALAFSPDGTLLASGARDNTLKLWNLSWIRRELQKLALDWQEHRGEL